jgi:hypothetical protein
MANTSDQEPLESRPRCEEYGLKREEVEYDPFSCPDFLEEFVGETEWKSWAITRIDDGSGKTPYSDKKINTYATSVERGAYITYSIDTTQGDTQGAPRITDMKHRDLIIDNWLSAGGNLHDLTFVGTSIIINKFGVLAAKHAFLVEGLDFVHGGQVEMYPDDELYNGCVMSNPFVAGQGRLAKSLGRRIKRFIFITLPDYYTEDETFDPFGDDEPICHLVMEMAKPDEPDVSIPSRPRNLSPEWRELLANISLLDWIKIRIQVLEQRKISIERLLGLTDVEIGDGYEDQEDGDEEVEDEEDEDEEVEYEEDEGEAVEGEEDGGEEENDNGDEGEDNPLFSDDVNIE